MTERVQSQMEECEMRFLRKIKGFTNITTLQFMNFSTASHYFLGSKDLSLDGLAIKAECLMNSFPSKLYILK